MSTFRELQQGLGRAWESVSEGWHALRERAAEALTRFRPLRPAGGLETADEQVALNAPRWGLLPAELRVDEDEVVVRLEVPGMSSDDFAIEVAGDALVVRGEKHLAREQQRGRYHLMECAYGSFERAIPLPVPVREAQARASYRGGVLTVRLPKAEHARTRRIEVQTG